MAKHTKSKPKSKENLKQQSILKTARIRDACTSCTIQHRTVLIIFRLILRTIIIAEMLSIVVYWRGEGGRIAMHFSTTARQTEEGTTTAIGC